MNIIINSNKMFWAFMDKVEKQLDSDPNDKVKIEKIKMTLKAVSSMPELKKENMEHVENMLDRLNKPAIDKEKSTGFKFS